MRRVPPVSAKSLENDALPEMREALLREQHLALTRLVPVLYGAVIIATLTIVFAYSGTVPAWINKMLPGAILILVILRMRYWIKARKTSKNSSLDLVRRDIRGTMFLGPAIAFCFTLVGLVMMHYGSAYQQALAIISIWIVAVASAFCLASLPIASIAVVICAAVPLVYSFVTSGNHVMQTMSGVVGIVTLQVIYMLVQNFRAFEDMVGSRVELQRRSDQAERAKEKAIQLAFTDHLTKLSNRRHFEFLLDERITRDKNPTPETQSAFTVGVADLDGFKPINDMYGHGVGDQVLMQVANRMQEIIFGKGHAARIGGDEFAFLLDDVSTEDDALAFALEFRQALAKPFAIGDGCYVQISGSVGLAIRTETNSDPKRLLDQADIALYRSKTHGRGEACIFTVDFETAALNEARVEQGLRKAILDQAFVVHFQPIHNLTTGHLSGFESLARWHDPELDHVSPAIFIPIAERMGLIEQLTDDLLRKAAQAATAWPNYLTLSFNLSSEQLIKPTAAKHILALLEECKLPTSQFEAEVTETAIMKDLPAAQKTIEELKAAGVCISLDDFGTGYSSLSQIRNLPLDKVKIDKSFVDEICNDGKIHDLVGSIVSMCNTLDLRCIAEGIEHAEQLNELKSIGCHSGQGYLFARPAPQKDIQFTISSDAQNHKFEKRDTQIQAA